MSYVPLILSGEQKTKPTQHSVKELLSMGIQPEVIIGRCDRELNEDTKRKISLFCGVDKSSVLSNPNLENIYNLPLILNKQNLVEIIITKLKLPRRPVYSSKFEYFVEKIHKCKEEVSIGIVGKYTGLEDAYMSIKEAFKHAGALNSCKVNLTWIEAEDIKLEELNEFDGLLVPGGFGSRGGEGKIAAIKYARERNIPLLGICLGMQLMIVEFARNVCGLKDANTTESDSTTPNTVIDLLPEQKEIYRKGGTMRL